MPTLTPYKGRSLDRLVALINQDNETAFKLGVDFDLGPPIAFNGPGGRNTRARLTPRPGSVLYTPQDLAYWRLGIDALSRLPEGSVDTVPLTAMPFTTHEILPLLNAALGVDLLPEEVEDITYTTVQSSYPLTIRAGSHGWKESTYWFHVERVNEYSLATAIKDGALSAFSYTRPGSP